MNNKQLYESIMLVISKEIKKALNESLSVNWEDRGPVRSQTIRNLYPIMPKPDTVEYRNSIKYHIDDRLKSGHMKGYQLYLDKPADMKVFYDIIINAIDKYLRELRLSSEDYDIKRAYYIHIFNLENFSNFYKELKDLYDALKNPDYYSGFPAFKITNAKTPRSGYTLRNGSGQGREKDEVTEKMIQEYLDKYGENGIEYNKFTLNEILSMCVNNTEKSNNLVYVVCRPTGKHIKEAPAIVFKASRKGTNTENKAIKHIYADICAEKYGIQKCEATYAYASIVRIEKYVFDRGEVL